MHDTSPSSKFVKNLKSAAGEPVASEEKEYAPVATRECVVFPSILSDQMKEDEIKLMVDYAINNLDSAERAMGRTVTGSGGDGSVWWAGNNAEFKDFNDDLNPARSFLGKRELFDLTYHNRVEWRAFVLGNLFAESNRTLPIARRGTRQMAARAVRNYFSVDPWVKATGTNKPDGALSMDENIAIAGEKFFRFKAQEAGLKAVFQRAVERAFVVGECVLKTRHTTKFNYYRTSMSILVDEQGKVVLGKDGDYIVEGKDSFSRQEIQPEQVEPVEGADEAAMHEGEVSEVDPNAPLFLDRDGVTPIPPNSMFEWRENLLRKHTTYNGPTTEIVPTRDFICMPNEKDVHDAPFIAHLLSISPFDVVNTFGQEILNDAKTPAERIATTTRFIQLLSDMDSDGTNAKTAGDLARPELSESAAMINHADFGPSRSEVAECYMEYDADGDGTPEQIFLAIDRVRRKLIYCNYLQNVTADGERPFNVLTVNRVHNRWFGIGMLEQMEHLQQSIDLWLNRASFSSSSSGCTPFFNQDNVYEGDQYAGSGMHLPFNTGQVFHLKPGKKAEETLTYVTVPEVKMREFLEFMSLNMQMASNEAAILGTNDMQAAGLDSSQLATGIRDASAKGDEMFGLVTSHLDGDIERAVQRWAGILFTNMDDEEEFSYGEGDTRMLDVIKKTDIRRIRYHFALTLIGGKNEQVVQAMQVALPQTMAWGQQSSAMMAASLPFMDAQLRALQIPNARSVLEAMVAAKQQEEGMMQAQAAAEAQAQAGPTKPTL